MAVMWGLIILCILIIIFLTFKDKITKFSRLFWKRTKKVGSGLLRLTKRFLEIIIKIFLDLASNTKHYTFVIVMFLISVFIFFIYLILKDIWRNNFGDPQWVPLKILFWVVSILLLLFLVLLITSKPQRFIIQYVIFPAINFSIFYLKDKVEMSDYLFAILIFLSVTAHYFILKKAWKDPNKKILFTIFLITLLLAFGFTFIDSFTGEKRMDFGLNDCYNNNVRVGEIKCSDILNHVVVGHKVSCELEVGNRLIPEEGLVKFTYLDGESETLNISKRDDYSFLVPERVGNIYFEFKNNESCLSVGYSRNYPESKEFREEKINFMYMILALLAFCLISVPVIIKNFSDM